MDIFYDSMNETSKGIIDASCCASFKRKSVDEARDLIEDLARCNMKNPSESSGSNSREKGSWIIELNKMIAMEAKLDAIMHRMDSQEKRLHSAHEIGAVDREGMRRSAEGLAEEDPYRVEETKYLNEQKSYHFCHAPDPGPTRLANPNRFQGAKPYTGTPYFILYFFSFLSELNLYLWYTNNFCNNQQSFRFTNELPPEWDPLKFIHIY